MKKDTTPLRQGDTVKLKSGGPLMTVVSVINELVSCNWFIATSSLLIKGTHQKVWSNIQSGNFNEKALERSTSL